MTHTSRTLIALALSQLFITGAAADDKQDAAARAASELDSQLKALETLPRLTPCQQAVVIALKDAKVRKLFLSKATNPCYELKDVCCLDIPHVPEQEYVLFNFDCKLPCICILDPQFLVVVDKIKKSVAINDPYQGPTTPSHSVLDTTARSGEDDSQRVTSTDFIEGVVSGCDVICNGNEFRMYAFITDPNSGKEIQVTTRFEAFQRVLLAASDMREPNIGKKKPLVEVEYTNQSPPHYVRRIRVLDR